MTIDERIEALAVNLKLQAIGSSKRDQQITDLAKIAGKNSGHINQLAKIAQIAYENIKALLSTAVAHEQRIQHLEGPNK